MRKTRQFKPSMTNIQLEDRVVLSTTSAAYLAPAVRPITSSAAVIRAENQIHSALLTYQSSVSAAILYTEAQVNAGHVSLPTATNLLVAYIGNRTSLLFTQTRSAATNLPYGGGFNGYVNSTYTTFGDLPSGADSLYADLTYPSGGGLGPIGNLQNNLYNSVTAGDLAGALTAVDSAAIHSTYAAAKSTVVAYVVHGVQAHDFNYRR